MRERERDESQMPSALHHTWENQIKSNQTEDGNCKNRSIDSQLSIHPQTAFFFKLSTLGCENLFDQEIKHFLEIFSALLFSWKSLIHNGIWKDVCVGFLIIRAHISIYTILRSFFPLICFVFYKGIQIVLSNVQSFLRL